MSMLDVDTSGHRDDLPSLVRSRTGSSIASENDIEVFIEPGTPCVSRYNAPFTVYEEPEALAINNGFELEHSVTAYESVASWTETLSTSYPKRRSIPMTGCDSLILERRKALLVGINYINLPPWARLDGAHGDVEKVKSFLQDVHGWDEECIRVLKDDNGDVEDQPTLDNIRHELRKLVDSAEAGDRLFFYYAGHGRQIKDLDGDEEDGMDEVIVSSDNRNLVDDELHMLLVRPLPAGCRLTALFDCCSSGTVLDLPYTLSCNDENMTRWPSNGRQLVRKHSSGDVILVSACEDSAKAYEVGGKTEGGGGALTRAFLTIMKQRRNLSHYDLLQALYMQIKACQRAQISSSHEINLHARFYI